MKNENDFYKNLISTFESMCSVHSSDNLFCDFLEISAIAIQNEHMKYIDEQRFDELESRYFEIIKKYSESDLTKIAKMFGYLQCEALKRLNNGNMSDILGEMFHHLQLHNTYRGQFFTPQHIADFMAAITFSTNYRNDTNDKGYVRVAEPCCGSGVMLFGAAKAFNEAGGDHKTQFMAVATDIDIKCTWMTFIQCSLFKIPAIVNHGNTLTMETFSTFYTMPFLTQDWEAKKQKPLNLDFGNYSNLEALLDIF